MPDIENYKVYNDRMRRSMWDKAFFMDKIPGTELLIDYGCADGSLILSPGKKTFGRSAYLCRSAECVEKALKRGLIKKHLKCDHPETFEKMLLEEVHES